jgi:hypothetical protein
VCGIEFRGYAVKKYSSKGGLTKVKRCNPRRIGIQRLFPVGSCFQKSAWRAVAAIRTTRCNSNGFDDEEIKGKHQAQEKCTSSFT